jgi:3-phosphoshikimate 1-carboxyvinyltransferase
MMDHIKDIPGDKSISHRCVILTSLSKSTLTFNRFLTAEDCLNTANIFRQCGIEMTDEKDVIDTQRITIKGKGLRGLSKPTDTLYVGNSGTGIRLITGVLAGQNFDTTIEGDSSIAKRPMKRITSPLSLMNAKIAGQSREGSSDVYPPLNISPSSLIGTEYTLPVASAQVKSAILLAALYANSPTTVIEPKFTRDHTEVLMSGFGINITKDGGTITLTPPENELEFEGNTELTIPADFSSAAFFIVLGLIRSHENGIQLHDIGLNPTRSALIQVLQAGAKEGALTVDETGTTLGEPLGNISVSSSPLDNDALSNAISDDIIPYIIDEVPILSVAALFGTGTLKIRNAEELRVKESDRIASTVAMIKALGGVAIEYVDGLDVI